MRTVYLGLALPWVDHRRIARLESPLGIGLWATLVALALALLLARRRRLRRTAESSASASASTLALVRSGRRARLRRSEAPNGLEAARAPWVARLVAKLPRSRGQDLVSLLAPYRIAPPAPDPGDDDGTWALLTFPQLRRLAIAFEDLGGRVGFGPPLDRAIERAGARLRSGEVMTVWLLGAALLVALGWALAGPIGSLLVAIIALAAPIVALQAAAEHRAKLFATQLPDVLKLTASSLRAGFSLLQGLEGVTKQLQEPSAGELQRVLTEARLGRPVEEALEAAASRIGNRDFSESVAAVGIQQEAGGNLAALFETLADTMLQRLQLRREIRTLTAEARLSAYVLGGLPVLIAIFLFATSRQYLLILFHTQAGKVALLASVMLQLLGFLWMYRTVKIEG